MLSREVNVIDLRMINASRWR